MKPAGCSYNWLKKRSQARILRGSGNRVVEWWGRAVDEGLAEQGMAGNRLLSPELVLVPVLVAGREPVFGLLEG